jgi:hypothetical protein
MVFVGLCAPLVIACGPSGVRQIVGPGVTEAEDAGFDDDGPAMPPAPRNAGSPPSSNLSPEGASADAAASASRDTSDVALTSADLGPPPPPGNTSAPDGPPASPDRAALDLVARDLGGADGRGADAASVDAAFCAGPCGLLGEYFDDANLTIAKIVRVDPTIDFNWGADAPDPTLEADTFSVRWTGRIIPAFSETYTFTIRSDDGMRLWINNALLVEDWSNHAARDRSATVVLVARQAYDLRVEFYEDARDAVSQLFWASPSQPKQIVPASALTPAAKPLGPVDAGTGG